MHVLCFQRVVFCLLLFYLLVSVVPVLLHYPLSLVSLFVPCLTIFYALCHLRSESRSDHWPCGLLKKLTLTVTFFILNGFSRNKHHSNQHTFSNTDSG
ncbi:unnamed protein product [Heligmosomoides polygyrus]|uniref:Secreted protein n=1 Tax=Heligmosomoides polygyrus TaxID=6339 RepID=A0A183GJW0_HELPZ|nr:unnamed protein product [Heligmosomoides polygyrus]